eukprot:gene7395-biopygen21045
MLLRAALRKYASFGRVHGLTASPVGTEITQIYRFPQRLRRHFIPAAHSWSGPEIRGGGTGGLGHQRGTPPLLAPHTLVTLLKAFLEASRTL